ncbi:MAG: hypothetical protein GVY20_07540 [Bacteroidetes bacterium]|jgi:hypothetical protein|nr:hypothetical protein [Bacteroidota bacterium]
MQTLIRILWILLFLIFLSAQVFAQNAFELRKDNFYQTFNGKVKLTETDRLVHAPLMLDKEMSEEFFYRGREIVLKPLMDTMNQYLDSLAWSEPATFSLATRGLPWLFVGSSEAETAPPVTMMLRDDHDVYPPMALYLEKPSKSWRQSFALQMTEQDADFALLIWVGLTEYPKADKGFFKKKVILGTDYEHEIRFLSAVDKPVEVLQLTGVLLDREGNVVRAGAEGFLHKDSPFWVQALEAGTTIDDNAIEKLLTGERHDDLPGRPLAWKVAMENLVSQLTKRARIS